MFSQMKTQPLKIGSKLAAPADIKNIVPAWERHYQAFLKEAIQKWNDHGSGTELAGDTYGVDPTTIRAISLVKQPPTPKGEERDTGGPLKVFTTWAGKQEKKILEDVARHRSFIANKSMNDLRDELAASLCKWWAEKSHAHAAKLTQAGVPNVVPLELSVAHRYKMVNLFIRYLRIPATRGKHELLLDAVTRYAEIPLDKKSITVLQIAFGGEAPSKGFSMGHIKAEPLYDHYQKLARLFCAKAGGSPMLLDVFAWHNEEAHGLYA